MGIVIDTNNSNILDRLSAFASSLSKADPAVDGQGNPIEEVRPMGAPGPDGGSRASAAVKSTWEKNKEVYRNLDPDDRAKVDKFRNKDFSYRELAVEHETQFLNTNVGQPNSDAPGSSKEAADLSNRSAEQAKVFSSQASKYKNLEQQALEASRDKELDASAQNLLRDDAAGYAESASTYEAWGQAATDNKNAYKRAQTALGVIEKVDALRASQNDLVNELTTQVNVEPQTKAQADEKNSRLKELKTELNSHASKLEKFENRLRAQQLAVQNDFPNLGADLNADADGLHAEASDWREGAQIAGDNARLATSQGKIIDKMDKVADALTTGNAAIPDPADISGYNGDIDPDITSQSILGNAKNLKDIAKESATHSQALDKLANKHSNFSQELRNAGMRDAALAFDQSIADIRQKADDHYNIHEEALTESSRYAQEGRDRAIQERSANKQQSKQQKLNDSANSLLQDTPAAVNSPDMKTSLESGVEAKRLGKISSDYDSKAKKLDKVANDISGTLPDTDTNRARVQQLRERADSFRQAAQHHEVAQAQQAENAKRQKGEEKAAADHQKAQEEHGQRRQAHEEAGHGAHSSTLAEWQPTPSGKSYWRHKGGKKEYITAEQYHAMEQASLNGQHPDEHHQEYLDSKADQSAGRAAGTAAGTATGGKGAPETGGALGGGGGTIMPTYMMAAGLGAVLTTPKGAALLPMVAGGAALAKLQGFINSRARQKIRAASGVQGEDHDHEAKLKTQMDQKLDDALADAKANIKSRSAQLEQESARAKFEANAHRKLDDIKAKNQAKGVSGGNVGAGGSKGGQAGFHGNKTQPINHINFNNTQPVGTLPSSKTQPPGGINASPTNMNLTVPEIKNNKTQPLKTPNSKTKPVKTTKALFGDDIFKSGSSPMEIYNSELFPRGRRLNERKQRHEEEKIESPTPRIIDKTAGAATPSVARFTPTIEELQEQEKVERYEPGVGTVSYDPEIMDDKAEEDEEKCLLVLMEALDSIHEIPAAHYQDILEEEYLQDMGSTEKSMTGWDRMQMSGWLDQRIHTTAIDFIKSITDE